MIVGCGDNHVLVIGITEGELGTLRAGLTLTYEGQNFLTKDVLVFWGRDKAHVLEQLRAAGATISGDIVDKYLKDERTDNPRKPS